MVDIHWEGCSQRSAPQKRHMAHLRRCAGCTPRKLSSRDGGDGKLQPSIGGDHTRQAHGHMSCSDLGRAQNSTQTSQSLCGVPEYLNLSGLDLGSAYNIGPASERSWQSNLEPKQCRQGKHTYHEPGQTQCGWNTASTCQCYLFAVFLPPHSKTEEVSLKVFTPIPLCQGRNKTLKRPANRRS